MRPDDWKQDSLITLRNVCADARRRRGWTGWLLAIMGEWFDRTRWAVRRAAGRGVRITGGTPQRDLSRDPRRGSRGALASDVRHAIRRLRSQPGTAVMAVAMLALAIGVTSAMFTVADHMLLRPAPFRDPDHLVRVSIGTDDKHARAYLDRRIVQAWRSTPAFTAIDAFFQDGVVLDGRDGLVSAGAIWITPGVFGTLDATPLMGRVFSGDEGQPGREDRVVISEKLWRTVFSADPGILGKAISLSGTSATVIGVMPASFHFPYENVTIWRPLDLDVPPAKAVAYPLEVYARLNRAMPAADVARLATLAANQAVPPKQPGAHVLFRAMSTGSLDDYSRTAIMVLSAGVGLVFLLLCANVTNLILARTMARRQEFGVCSALGASRGRLLRQAFIENLGIGLVASVAGCAAAWLLVALARTFLPEAFLLRTLNPVQIDARALIATSVFGLVATVAAGLPPAWIGTKVNASDSLKQATRGGTESRASRGWTRALLVGEVALAAALLVGAGVLVQSFVKLVRADRGLDAHGVLTAWVSLPEMYFKDRPSRTAFAETLREQVRGLPGMRDIALSSGLPPHGGGFSWGVLETDTGTTNSGDLTLFSTSVGPRFFQVYRIALLQGREFQPGDGRDQVIVGQQLADMLWPGVSPLGHAFRFKDAKDWNHVIGVAREVRSPLGDPREDLPEFYRPLTLGGSEVMIGARCDEACPSEAAFRDRVRATSAQALLYQFKSLEGAYLEEYARPRAAAALAFVFAFVAVLASAGGLFSVLSYAVGRRRREFGIRAAMGAQPRQLRRVVFADGVRIAAVGIGIGATAAWALSRSLSALAFGVTMASPIVWLVVIGVIAVTTLAAAWRPAVQAMRADPLSLLRDE